MTSGVTTVSGISAVGVSGSGLPAGGAVGQVATNTAPGAGDWETVSDLVPGTTTTVTTPAANHVAVEIVPLTGPVTTSGANVSAVTDNSITNVMVAQMATNTLKGNNTGSTANAADLTVAQVQALLSATSTWAARGSGAFDGQIKLITDIGVGGALVRWIAASSKWYLLHTTTLVADFGIHSAPQNTSENITNQFTIAAGILTACSRLAIKTGWGKSGTTDAWNVGRVRIGTAGTTADTSFSTITSATVTTASRSATFEMYLATNIANTTLRRIALLAGTTNWNLNQQTVVYPSDITVSDFSSNALIVSLNTTMAAATTDVASSNQLIIELFP